MYIKAVRKLANDEVCDQSIVAYLDWFVLINHFEIGPHESRSQGNPRSRRYECPDGRNDIGRAEIIRSGMAVRRACLRSCRPSGEGSNKGTEHN
jgi:hypothetical protein